MNRVQWEDGKKRYNTVDQEGMVLFRSKSKDSQNVRGAETQHRPRMEQEDGRSKAEAIGRTINVGLLGGPNNDT